MKLSELIDAVTGEPEDLEWIGRHAGGEPYPPRGPHYRHNEPRRIDGHRYDWCCAICRAGDHGVALEALLLRVAQVLGVDVDDDLQPLPKGTES